MSTSFDSTKFPKDPAPLLTPSAPAEKESIVKHTIPEKEIDFLGTTLRYLVARFCNYATFSKVGFLKNWEENSAKTMLQWVEQTVSSQLNVVGPQLKELAKNACWIPLAKATHESFAKNSALALSESGDKVTEFICDILEGITTKQDAETGVKGKAFDLIAKTLSTVYQGNPNSQVAMRATISGLVGYLLDKQTIASIMDSCNLGKWTNLTNFVIGFIGARARLEGLIKHHILENKAFDVKNPDNNASLKEFHDELLKAFFKDLENANAGKWTLERLSKVFTDTSQASPEAKEYAEKFLKLRGEVLGKVARGTASDIFTLLESQGIKIPESRQNKVIKTLEEACTQQTEASYTAASMAILLAMPQAENLDESSKDALAQLLSKNVKSIVSHPTPENLKKVIEDVRTTIETTENLLKDITRATLKLQKGSPIDDKFANEVTEVLKRAIKKGPDTPQTTTEEIAKPTKKEGSTAYLSPILNEVKLCLESKELKSNLAEGLAKYNKGEGISSVLWSVIKYEAKEKGGTVGKTLVGTVETASSGVRAVSKPITWVGGLLASNETEKQREVVERKNKENEELKSTLKEITEVGTHTSHQDLIQRETKITQLLNDGKITKEEGENLEQELRKNIETIDKPELKELLQGTQSVKKEMGITPQDNWPSLKNDLEKLYQSNEDALKNFGSYLETAEKKVVFNKQRMESTDGNDWEAKELIKTNQTKLEESKKHPQEAGEDLLVLTESGSFWNARYYVHEGFQKGIEENKIEINANFFGEDSLTLGNMEELEKQPIYALHEKLVGSSFIDGTDAITKLSYLANGKVLSQHFLTEELQTLLLKNGLTAPLESPKITIWLDKNESNPQNFTASITADWPLFKNGKPTGAHIKLNFSSEFAVKEAKPVGTWGYSRHTENTFQIPKIKEPKLELTLPS